MWKFFFSSEVFYFQFMANKCIFLPVGVSRVWLGLLNEFPTSFMGGVHNAKTTVLFLTLN